MVDQQQMQPAYIFTTLRLDNSLLSDEHNTVANLGVPSAIYLARYHLQRLREMPFAGTAKAGLLNDADGLKFFEDAITTSSSQSKVALEVESSTESDEREGGLRVKVSVFEDGSHAIEVPLLDTSTRLLFPTSLDGSTKLPSWNVSLDVLQTTPTMSTKFKTSDRNAYERAAKDSGVVYSQNQEILLYNTSDEMMDGSITTPYFKRDGQWLTPSLSSGGLISATRQYALDTQLCSEGVVPKSSVKVGERVWLSNAFRGFFPAVVV